MSYSFSVVARSKAEAKAKVTNEMARVMAAQPPHCAEGMGVVKAAHALIDTLADDVTTVSVAMHGTVSTTDYTNPAAALTDAGCGINVTGG